MEIDNGNKNDDRLPKASNTKVGRQILVISSVVVAIGIFGAAVKFAHDNWAWVWDLAKSDSETEEIDCNDLEKLTREEWQKCLNQ